MLHANFSRDRDAGCSELGNLLLCNYLPSIVSLQVVLRHLPPVRLASDTRTVTVDPVELVVGSLDPVALLRRERDLRLRTEVLDVVVMRLGLGNIARCDGTAGRIVGRLLTVE